MITTGVGIRNITAKQRSATLHRKCDTQRVHSVTISTSNEEKKLARWLRAHTWTCITDTQEAHCAGGAASLVAMCRDSSISQV